MNNKIGNIANFFQRKGVFTSRLERIKREGSPYYPYNLPITAAGAVQQIHIPTLFPESRKYQPLDYVEIVNNGPATPITVLINKEDTFYCPPGTQRTIHGKGIALWELLITNNGVGATVLGLIRFSFKKEAMTINKWAAEH